jgi:hypothetical protein
MNLTRRLILLLTLLALAACNPPAPTTAPIIEATTTAAAVPTEAPTDAPTEPPAPTDTPPPTEPPAPAFAPPIAEYEGVISVVPSEAQLAAGFLLDTITYAIADYESILIAHGKLAAPLTTYAETENDRLIAPAPAEPLSLNTTRTFYISNTDLETLGEVEFKLLGISDHAYFWFDTDRAPDPAKIQNAMDGFESVVGGIQSIFGAEHALGIDGDPRIHILHPAATKVCNVNEANAHNCGLGGYFWSVNQYPSEHIWFSNLHEGLIMNYDAYILGGEDYIDTLTHEYRHLVEYWYRDNPETWETEGQAVMAEDLLGFRGANITFANTYLSDPDIQLNSWVSGSSRSIFHYGYGYVFSRYIYDRFGADFFSLWAKYPTGGFDGLDALFAEQGLAATARQTWLDYLIAITLLNHESVPPAYHFDPDFAGALDPVGSATLSAGRTVEEEVRQYGADIYRILPNTSLNLTFTGSTLNSLLGRVPPSGEYFWYGGRAAAGLRTLTLAADLSGVASATLNYSTYFKLSRAFGFGYVVISTDGGQTWSGLVTENMKGAEPGDDPYDFALTDRFYTVTAPGGSWVDERIDLTPYAGQTVLIRWESDSGDRDTGFAIDNICIPEIGFFDDVETEAAGWTSDGWLRVTAYIPQAYYLTLLTFADGAWAATPVALDELNAASLIVNSGEHDAYLIVAAIAPQSQQPTAYTIVTAAP